MLVWLSTLLFVSLWVVVFPFIPPSFLSSSSFREMEVESSVPPTDRPTDSLAQPSVTPNNTNNENGALINFRVLQWNCRNLHTNMDQFKQFLSTMKLQVLCLQSVGRRPGDLPVLEGFYYPPYYKQRRDGVVAVATYVSSDLRAQAVKAPCGNDTLAVCVRIGTKSRNLNILNIYYPDWCAGRTDWMTALETDTDWVVGGDFNAHHAMWGGAGTAPRGGGPPLAENISNSDLFLLNDGSHTRFPDRAEHAPSAIDLSLVSPTLAPRASWEVVPDDLGSDHAPILIQINNQSLNFATRDKSAKYNYDKADWVQFDSVLRNSSVSVHDDVDAQYEAYRDLVLGAANQCIPKKGVGRRGELGNPWWTDRCKEAVKEKKRGFNRYKRKPSDASAFDEYKAARLRCKRTIAEAKKEYWDRILRSEERRVGKECSL